MSDSLLFLFLLLLLLLLFFLPKFCSINRVRSPVQRYQYSHCGRRAKSCEKIQTSNVESNQVGRRERFWWWWSRRRSSKQKDRSLCARVGGKSASVHTPFQIAVCDEDDMICVVVMEQICYKSLVKLLSRSFVKTAHLTWKKQTWKKLLSRIVTIVLYHVFFVFRSR